MNWWQISFMVIGMISTVVVTVVIGGGGALYLTALATGAGDPE